MEWRISTKNYIFRVLILKLLFIDINVMILVATFWLNEQKYVPRTRLIQLVNNVQEKVICVTVDHIKVPVCLWETESVITVFICEFSGNTSLEEQHMKV